MKVFQTKHVNVYCCYTQFISCRIIQLKTNHYYYIKIYRKIQYLNVVHRNINTIMSNLLLLAFNFNFINFHLKFFLKCYHHVHVQ